MPKNKPLSLTEIAERIQAHLKRFEADPEFDKPISGTRVEKAGVYMHIYYIFTRPARRHSYSLKRTDALEYLDWLEKGNVGHYHEFWQWKYPASMPW